MQGSLVIKSGKVMYRIDTYTLPDSLGLNNTLVLVGNGAGAGGNATIGSGPVKTAPTFQCVV